jgi:hypothetical protein
MRISSSRVVLFALLALLIVTSAWFLAGRVLIPLLIDSAYRGDSLELFNRLITGQASQPVGHYLAQWNSIYWEALVSMLLLIVCLSILILSWLRSHTVDACIQRYKLWYFGAVLFYLIAAHYWFLGFTSYDGFTYRIPPIVELVQQGNLGGDKFDTYAARNFYPFFELVHVPFLKLLGLPGLFFSFSLVLFPLATLAVYWFAFELTRDRRWATYSAMIYITVPFVNEQPFSGYIDFAVVGALALFLCFLLRILRSDRPSLWLWACWSMATVVFSLSRQHTPYIAVLLLVLVILWFLEPRDSRSVRLQRSWLGVAFTFVLGMAPAIYQQARKTFEFGSPLYPYQFKFLSITSVAGQPLDMVMRDSGLQSPTWGGMLAAFGRGWLWPGKLLPIFFDSRLLGVGLLLWIGILIWPSMQRAMDRQIKLFLLLLSAIGFVTLDFWLPRYAYSLVLVVVIYVGGGLRLLAVNGPRWAYAGLVVVCLLQLLGRPLYVGLAISEFNSFYYHANLADSRWFISGPPDPTTTPEIYPDWGADLLIVYPVRNESVLPLYGRHLSNRIIGKLDPATLSGSCDTIGQLAQGSPRTVLIVDQTGLTATKCSWICEMPRPWGCMAQRLASSPGLAHHRGESRPSRSADQ